MSDANSSGIIFDDEKLNTFFNSMKRADRYKMVMNAYEIATHPLIDESKGALIRSLKRRSKTQNLYNSLGLVKGKKNGNSNFVEAKVGARKFSPYKGFHGHLVNSGTGPRQTKKGYTRGQIPATNFFTDSVESTQLKVNDELRTAIMSELEKEIQNAL